MLLTITASAQENLLRQASDSKIGKRFRTVKKLPITSVKNQYRSGTCWAYATLDTTYLFLNRHALSKELREAIKTSDFN